MTKKILTCVGGYLAAVVVIGLLLSSEALAVTYNATVSSKTLVPAGSESVAIRTFSMITTDNAADEDITSLSDDQWRTLSVTFDALVLGPIISSLTLYRDADSDDSFSADSDTAVQTRSFAGGEDSASFTSLSQSLDSTSDATVFFLVATFKSTASLGTEFGFNFSTITSTTVPDETRLADNTQSLAITGIVLTVDTTLSPPATVPNTSKITMLAFSMASVSEDFNSAELQLENDAGNFDSDNDSDGVSAVYVALDVGEIGVFEAGTDDIVATIASGNLSDDTTVTISFESPDDFVLQGTTLNYLLLYDIGTQTSIESSSNAQARIASLSATGGSSGIAYLLSGHSVDNAQVAIGGIEIKNFDSIVPELNFGPGSTVPMASFRLRSEAFGSTVNSLTILNAGDIRFITDPDDTDGITTIYLYQDDGDFEFDGVDRETLVTASVLGSGNQANIMRISNMDIFVPTYNQDPVATNELGFYIVYDVGTGVAVSSPNTSAGFQISEGSGQSGVIGDALVLQGDLPTEPSATVTIVDTSLGYSGVEDVAPVTINRGALNVPMIVMDLTAASDLSAIAFVVVNDSGTFSSAGNGVSSVSLYKDTDSNNRVDTYDVLLASTDNFTSATQVTLPAFSLSAGVSHVLLAYDIGPNIASANLNIRAKIDGLDSGVSTSVVLSGDLPIPRSGVLASAVEGLLSIGVVSANITSITNFTGTFDVQIEVLNNCETTVTIDSLAPRVYKTSLSGTDLSAEYSFTPTFTVPLLIEGGKSVTLNFVADASNIRTAGNMIMDLALLYESTETINVFLTRYSSASGFSGASSVNATFTASTTFNAQSGDLPTYISSITVNGLNFRSGNYVKANAQMSILFANSGAVIDPATLTLFLNGTQLIETSSGSSGYSYDSQSGNLVINDLGASSGILTLVVSDSAGNALESQTLTFTVQSDFSVMRVLAFPSPYTPSLLGNTLSLGFQSSREGSATIYIYGATGRLVQTLSLAAMTVGFNVVSWNGIDAATDKTLASGVYIIRVVAIDNAGKQVIARGKFAVY